MNKLYYMSVDEFLNKVTFKQLLSFLSKERQKQLMKLNYDIDKKLSLFAEIIVRIIICQKLNVNNSKLVFEKNEYGKPYIKGYTNLYYNISHTRNAIVVAFSDKPVGVDIEKVKHIESQIAKRFFTFEEQMYISKYPEKIDKHFYEVWTKKEAYIKYLGQGLSIKLNSFNVFSNVISKQIKSFEIDDYIVSVCSEYIDKKFEIVELCEENVNPWIIESILI